MEKDRRIQRERSRFPSRNREVSEVFSDRGPEGEAFESPSLRSYQKGVKRSVREDAFRGAGFPRFSSLFAVAVGMVLIFSLLIVALGYVSSSLNKTEKDTPVSKKQDRHSFSSTSSSSSSASSSQTSESSNSAKKEKSESDKKSKQLTSKNSPYVDENNGVHSFSLDELLNLIHHKKLEFVTPEETVEQFGKAYFGSYSYLSSELQGTYLTYKQPDQFGFVYISFKKIGDTEKISTFSVANNKSKLGEPTKTTDEFQALMPQDGQEGMEIREVVSQLGNPDNMVFIMPNPGEVNTIALVYSTTDSKRVSLYFDESSDQYRLKRIVVQ